MLLQARLSPTHQHTYLTDDPLSFSFKFFQNNLLHEQVFNLTKQSETPSFQYCPPSNIASDYLILLLPLLTTKFGLVKSLEYYSEGFISGLIKMERLLQNYLYISRRKDYLDFPLYYSTYIKYGLSNYIYQMKKINSYNL